MPYPDTKPRTSGKANTSVNEWFLSFNMQTEVSFWPQSRCSRYARDFLSLFIPCNQAIMIHMRGVTGEQLTKTLIRKMAPPLVTLLSSPPEVQWVALRNINLLLQKQSGILKNEMRVFFCKYNDPLYVHCISRWRSWISW